MEAITLIKKLEDKKDPIQEPQILSHSLNIFINLNGLFIIVPMLILKNWMADPKVPESNN